MYYTEAGLVIKILHSLVPGYSVKDNNNLLTLDNNPKWDRQGGKFKHKLRHHSKWFLFAIRWKERIEFLLLLHLSGIHSSETERERERKQW